MRSLRTRVSLVATLASLALASSIALASVVAHDLTGNWDFTVVTENGTGTPAVVLKQAGDTLTGTYESRMMGIRALMGVVKGDSLEFELSPSGDAGAPTLTFIGVIVDPDHLKGIVDFGGMGGADFTAVRKP
jgi:hypothetical protein